ncbi:hypothetical protein [Sulfolobus monocaudavirus SMV3]|uniref:virion structural protein n=1 Tax=Sulfolobus monocaudavirus SMV3 TaxID=1732177 RepID=UPI000705F7E0|nr:virion structural protein [Sulfolobus monocaudavirus SMV3]ALG96983.1 hypothetical protein [Sulfolobus monocaudavirus SMV3]
MTTPQQPQVKSNPNSTNQTTSQTLSWEVILKSPRIEKQHVDFALSHINDAPQMPVEFVYNQLVTDIKISPPASIAISGAGGIIGAILVLRHTISLKYFITTKEVLSADEKSPLFLAKYALELLSKKYNDTEVITIELNEFEKIKLLLKQGGVYISGLPYELVVQLSQLAGFGRLWHYSSIQRKFYVF